MNILVDYHHGNLYKSLHLLLEKRLGHQMFRPIGRDWLYNGYFKVAEPYGYPEDTIEQYLGINDKDWNTFTNLNGSYELKDGVYYIYDEENEISHKAITFETFRNMRFDLIISTHPLHENWKELLHFQSGAKYIVQLGNEGQKTDNEYVMSSVMDFIPRENQKVFQYHQEFDLSEYMFTQPSNYNKIKSFVIALPEPELYQQYKDALPEFDFAAYGVGSPDGTVHGGYVAEMMQDSTFGWHVKPQDGFGHAIWKWAFSGRPLIGKGSYYQGKSAGCLWKDGVTCIDLDKHTFEENVELIREAAKPENHKRMSEAIYCVAMENCDFNKEANEFKNYLVEVMGKEV